MVMQNAHFETLTGGITTAAVLCYFSLSSPYCLPEENLFTEAEAEAVSQWYDPNPYYKIYRDKSNLDTQIEIIHRFVSYIVENSQDLNPEFSKVVDKYFWDLA
jgi:hypothetical protein